MIITCAIKKEELYKKIYNEGHSNSYVSYLRGKRCVDEASFFQEISASFQFPCYFGENWAAFDECICDLEWLQFQRIFVAFDDFGSAFGGDKALQSRLIKYFSIMIEYWNSNDVSVEIWLNN